MHDKFQHMVDIIKEYKHLRTDAEVATALGMQKSNFSDYRRRGTIPIKQLKRFAESEHYSLDELLGSNVEAKAPPASGRSEKGPTGEDGYDLYIPDHRLTDREAELVRMLLHVLRGRWGGGYEKSLEQNVRSFYHACQVEEETQLPPTANDFKTKARNHSSGGGGSKG